MEEKDFIKRFAISSPKKYALLKSLEAKIEALKKETAHEIYMHKKIQRKIAYLKKRKKKLTKKIAQIRIKASRKFMYEKKMGIIDPNKDQEESHV